MKLHHGLLALAFSLPCFAGNVVTTEVSIVTISATAKTATGGIQSAQNSADSTQQIGCKLIVVKSRALNSSNLKGECLAIDPLGNQLSCLTSDHYMLEAISTISDTSVITFTSDTSANANDTCRSLTVENTSSAIQ